MRTGRRSRSRLARISSRGSSKAGTFMAPVIAADAQRPRRWRNMPAAAPPTPQAITTHQNQRLRLTGRPAARVGARVAAAMPTMRACMRAADGVLGVGVQPLAVLPPGRCQAAGRGAVLEEGVVPGLVVPVAHQGVPQPLALGVQGDRHLGRGVVQLAPRRPVGEHQAAAGAGLGPVGTRPAALGTGDDVGEGGAHGLCMHGHSAESRPTLQRSGTGMKISTKATATTQNSAPGCRATRARRRRRVVQAAGQPPQQPQQHEPDEPGQGRR